MANKYPHLLSPIKVGNNVFKNRMTASPFRAKFVQGEEPYPTEAMITHHVNKARNGAAMVVCGALEVPVKIEAQKLHGHNGYIRYRVLPASEMGHGHFDGLMEHASDQESYLTQMTEAVHFYGSKATIGIMPTVPPQYAITGGMPAMGPPGVSSGKLTEELPEEMMDKIADEYALKAAFIRDLGFDGLFVHMCYRNGLLGQCLSPLTNKRADKYGGSPANRVRFPIMVADRIKQKCGQDFILEAGISGEEKLPGGQTLEDAIGYAREFAGHFDILQVRAGEAWRAHPTGYTMERTPCLYMAEAIKKSGADIAVLTIAGYIDPGISDNIIASGKADFIGMARAWISNPDYGRKLYEGRGDDIVPCLRCNKCHTSSYADPIASVCSVNPIWGFEHKIERMIDPPFAKKKVAVVGGGCAGMEAALVAASRGHDVTIYEKSESLGGLLNKSNNVSFRWPLKTFKNYLLNQVKKAEIKVILNTGATPEKLQDEGFEAVFAAIGAEPVKPDIPGIDGRNVFFAQDIYGSENKLAANVVIIGGGETGVETAIYLGEKGHKVTVLERGELLAAKTQPTTPLSAFCFGSNKEELGDLANFDFILQARAVAVSEEKVTYLDSAGKEQSVPAGSVVIAAGYQSRPARAMEFAGVGERFFIIGDCNKVGDVQKAMRSAYSNACMI